MLLDNNELQNGQEALKLVKKNMPSVNWQRVKLMDTCLLRCEVIDPGETSNSKYVGLEHIDTGRPYLTRWGVASDVKSFKFRFYPNDILYGKLRPYLEKSVKVDFEGICSTDILVFCPNPAIDADFLSYLIHTRDFTNHAIQSTGGVNHPRTAWSSLANFDISLPPFPEQRAISHTLQTVQQAIQTRRKELEIERERKATLMHHLFTYGMRNEPTKQSKIGEIPRSWEIVELEEVVEIVYGVQAAVAHLLNKAIGIPIFTNINISNEGRLDLTTLRYYDLPLDKRAKLLLKKGDLLFNWRSGSQDHVGKTALFDLDGEYTFSSFILRLRPRGDVNNIFLLYYLYYIKNKGYFIMQKQQSSINSVFNASIASKIPVAKASSQEQLNIANILQGCDSKIGALEKEITLHEELFRTLLDELMTGRISTLPLIEQLEREILTDEQRT